MEEKKDYSLLRLFDLEAAKRGEAICTAQYEKPRYYIAGPDLNDRICTQDPTDGELILVWSGDYRMAPLTWVEGKPVYKGDVLYSTEGFNCKHRVDRVDGNKAWQDDNFDDSDRGYVFVSNLTWTPPKTKRTVKLLAFISDNKLCWYVDDTVTPLGGLRVPSKDETVEVEG